MKDVRNAHISNGFDDKRCEIKIKKSNLDIVSKLPFFYGASNRDSPDKGNVTE